MRASVAVVMPARNEAGTVAAAVKAAGRSIDQAQADGLVGSGVVVEVAAHHCRDGTVEAAGRALRAVPGGAVTVDTVSGTVGEVRDRAVRRAIARIGAPPEQIWVLSTDADSMVDPAWVGAILREASAWEAVAVAGLVELDRRLPGPRAEAAYRALVARAARGSGRHQHDHAYGANLAARADAYLAVGGFPHVPVGEDRGLLDALTAAGYPVLRTRTAHVRTSARRTGRASGGLADLLASLS